MPENCALSAILPTSVSVAGADGDLHGIAPHPDEEEAMARAVERRRREFATGRACARMALAPWGWSERAIPVGPGGAPRWPAGVVGSITHCAGFRGAAVASCAEFAAIGIDAEPDAPLPDGLLRTIARPEERERIGSLTAARRGVSWDRLLFSIKESVYKACFPLSPRPLGFADASVSIDAHRGTFSARLLQSGPAVGGAELRALDGRWLATDRLVLTALVVAAGDGRGSGR